MEQAGPGRTGGDEPGDAAAEVALLRRRLAFYEGFDDLIQQNISRSGDLLRRASEQQARAERELAAARAELAETAAAQRHTLSALADELARMRGSLDALSARVDAARAALDRAAPSPVPAAGGGVGDAVASIAAAAGPPVGMPGAPTFAAATGVGADGRIADAGRGAAAAGPVDAPPAPVHPQVAQPVTASIVVHGMTAVDAARSFQTWLAERPGVRSVTPREFAAGVLRLEVTGAPVPPAEAARWPGAMLDVVETGPGALVLRVRGAGGF